MLLIAVCAVRPSRATPGFKERQDIFTLGRHGLRTLHSPTNEIHSHEKQVICRLSSSGPFVGAIFKSVCTEKKRVLHDKKSESNTRVSMYAYSAIRQAIAARSRRICLCDEGSVQFVMDAW